ncbi:MAG: glycosyltransferase family 39 protein [Opitutae bacterium]|nr:glycosyltransferase family 39 protein [Opitutae bacterium]
MHRLPRWIGLLLLPVLLTALALWLRWSTFGFSLWNVDESIHAAAARTILEGGVLYRDAVDIRHPLSYYAVAAVFAVFGKNNLWAVRALAALLVAGTGWFLFLAGRKLRHAFAGAAAGALYVLLATGALTQSDANASNTEWYVAFFSSAATAVFLMGGARPGMWRLFATGLLSACAFLSKQPALLEIAAPLAMLLYSGWRQALPARTVLLQMAAVAVGWLTPVLLAVGYFAAHGALRDAIFYTWIYNLTYYGPEIATADRFTALFGPFKLIGTTQPCLLGLWATGALVTLHRLLQRTPTPAETATNPGMVFVTVASLAALAGAASSGRSFDHYTVQFLAPFCLGAGLVLAQLGGWVRSVSTRGLLRLGAALLLLLTSYQAVSSAVTGRGRTLSEDPSHRIADYIREHTKPNDRIFVWGFHADIYLYANRRPASRYVFTTFQTGMIPWTNVAPHIDTHYAIVPGTMEKLLADLTARPPRYIVDCSAGPNRSWQKYPIDNYPLLLAFVRARYRQVESYQFVPQGFRLYQMRDPGDTTEDTAEVSLPADVAASLKLPMLGTPLVPLRASAPHGGNLTTVGGRREYFAHAPSSIVYRLPANVTTLHGGFGIRADAYGPENRGPTDGAEFIIRWRRDGGTEQALLRRLLRPREVQADRGIQSFQINLPPHQGGELELVIGTGLYENSASDWTFWSDLVLEKSP